MCSGVSTVGDDGGVAVGVDGVDGVSAVGVGVAAVGVVGGGVAAVGVVGGGVAAVGVVGGGVAAVGGGGGGVAAVGVGGGGVAGVGGGGVRGVGAAAIIGLVCVVGATCLGCGAGGAESRPLMRFGAGFFKIPRPLRPPLRGDGVISPPPLLAGICDVTSSASPSGSGSENDTRRELRDEARASGAFSADSLPAGPSSIWSSRLSPDVGIACCVGG